MYTCKMYSCKMYSCKMYSCRMQEKRKHKLFFRSQKRLFPRRAWAVFKSLNTFYLHPYPDRLSGKHLYLLVAILGKKRPKNSPGDETPSKKARKETHSPIHRSASGTSLASRVQETERPGSRESPEAGITEEAVRRYLSHKPMTTKDLLKKFKTKKTGLTSEKTVQQIAAILKKIVPEQKMIKGKLYLSLKRS